MYMCIYVYTHIHMCICVYTHIHKCIYVYTHLYMCIYVYTHTYMCIYVYTHIHLITQNTQINLNKRKLVNPKSTSNQPSKPCTVLQYPSRKTCLYTHIHVYICVYTQISDCLMQEYVPLSRLICVYTHIHTYTRTQSRTHKHTYTHSLPRFFSLSLSLSHTHRVSVTQHSTHVSSFMCVHTHTNT